MFGAAGAGVDNVRVVPVVVGEKVAIVAGGGEGVGGEGQNLFYFASGILRIRRLDSDIPNRFFRSSFDLDLPADLHHIEGDL